MEQIKYRFLNYKTYDKFKSDLEQGKIKNDSIVFIKDKLRIWARGIEYFGKDFTAMFLDLSDADTALDRKMDTKQDKLTIDKQVNIDSTNVVENHAVALALQDKIDSTALAKALLPYIKTADFETILEQKQNKLQAGDGIRIHNDLIEVTLDNDVFVVVDELPLEGNQNKIYIVEELVDGETKYLSYKYDGSDWIPLGEKAPTIDLSEYLKKNTADSLYLTKGSYLTPEDALTIYDTIEDTYQPKDDYITRTAVDTKLEILEDEIAEKYVLKSLVYTPNVYDWGEGDPNGGSNHGYNRMVTLTVQAYERLVEQDAVNPNTYYFTYEGEDEPVSDSWLFGGTFPIIFTDPEAAGVGKFPITLH